MCFFKGRNDSLLHIFYNANSSIYLFGRSIVPFRCSRSLIFMAKAVGGRGERRHHFRISHSFALAFFKRIRRSWRQQMIWHFIFALVFAQGQLTQDQLRWRKQELDLMQKLSEKIKKCDCKEIGSQFKTDISSKYRFVFLFYRNTVPCPLCFQKCSRNFLKILET